ncbi:MAG: hypothetical protein KJ958_05515 [Gammaproteobacteria bacterium]|nr:hypothetical protein [Gammaproteobacteria bacterium]MBU1978612.1 hypothetical protein [Gammaproteobacteria bacterium]
MSLNTLLEQIKTTLAAAQPLRVVTRSLKDFGDRPEADLVKGIFTLVSQGEGGYNNLPGREAMFGKSNTVLVGQIMVSEDSEPVAIESAELAMVEEIKGFVRALPAGIDSLQMKGFRQSGQLEHPYGWVSIDMEMMT